MQSTSIDQFENVLEDLSHSNIKVPQAILKGLLDIIILSFKV